MDICEMEKSSFIDYPNKISTVLFIKGCNFRCPYCHNSHILNSKESIDETYILTFLENRKKYIEAVTITGGEPTLYNELYTLISKIKNKNFYVKLDTNGTNPDMLNRLVQDNLIDYIAMDIKTSFSEYNKVTNSLVDINKIKKSIKVIKNSNIDYEFRTTVCKELISEYNILDIAKHLNGSQKYILQNFRDGDTILGGINKYHSYKLEKLQEIKCIIENSFDVCIIR
ncbi:anaerobic ribonucleoside-triphosphate reductase activating protein [Senegalia massiliensis]|uniref:Anaerobic ribonucleoside-triphosphate reductase activating protein n=1 Tax=Senegalia massiliensis TaxID=1720316 RepID=A0A845QWI9_9CLOT|nr:anaerobic ribonucleoside-triphosphate reductase activating protein [Senegalia massiliensis]NBI05528.1 anaerobic ribonucleoside-triphosphate reductase activating protein [Senegalia massiliensis]